MPWTEAMLAHLHRTGQSGWFTVESVLKSGMAAVPDERALRQWEVSYLRSADPDAWSRERRIEAGARQVCRVALLYLEKVGVVTVDPPSWGAGLEGRRVKKRVKLTPTAPGAKATPWVQVMYESLADGDWHDLPTVIRRMMREVPPQAAAHNYRVNYKSKWRSGGEHHNVKADSRQQQIRDGAYDLCRRAVNSAAKRGRVEFDSDLRRVEGKKVRWVGGYRPKGRSRAG